MNGKSRATWIVCLMTSMLLVGCGAKCPQIPREALTPLPAIQIPPTPELHTRKLLDVKTGQPAGLFFPTEDAFKASRYKIDLLESAELGALNTRTANKILEILRTPAKKWWQFWK